MVKIVFFSSFVSSLNTLLGLSSINFEEGLTKLFGGAINPLESFFSLK